MPAGSPGLNRGDRSRQRASLRPKRLDDFHFLNLPGGFLDGDDLGSAKAGANRILHAPIAGSQERLFTQFTRFITAGKLILGVCNGFQLLVKLGMLPGFDGITDRQTATLTFNDSGRFEDRWIHLRADAASPCVFTKGLKGLTLPVRHGEGKFVSRQGGPGEAPPGAPHLPCVQRRAIRKDDAGLPGEPQRLSGRDRGDLQRNGTDLRLDAPPGGVPPPDKPPPLDQRRTARGGGRARPFRNSTVFRGGASFSSSRLIMRLLLPESSQTRPGIFTAKSSLTWTPPSFILNP